MISSRALRSVLTFSLLSAALGAAQAQTEVSDPPIDHHFGKIPVGATFAAQYYSLINRGSAPVTVGQAVIDGQLATCAALGCPVVAPADFVVTGHSDGCSGRTLVPGEGCSTLVGFVPQAPGSRLAQLVFPIVNGAPLTRTLSGTGVSNPADCVMDWAERTLPGLLVQPTPTMVVGPFHARCYQGGLLCVGADVAVPTFVPASVYVYTVGELKSYGYLSDLAAIATHAPPSALRCNQPADGQ